MGNMIAKLRPGLRPLPPGLHFFSPSAMIATWFGTGRLRPMPGTIGSLAAIPPGFIIAAAFGPLGLLAGALILLWIGSAAATTYGEKSGEQDDQSIVIDEVIGMWIAAIPAETMPLLWLIAFLLFRLFDIYKLWPASFFDRRKKHGLDVILDDVIAGLYAFTGVATMALYTFMGR